MINKGSRIAKLSSKRPHARRAAPAKGRGQKNAYSVMNGSFRVLFPVAQTKTSRRRMASAVSTVVSKMKD